MQGIARYGRQFRFSAGWIPSSDRSGAWCRVEYAHCNHPVVVRPLAAVDPTVMTGSGLMDARPDTGAGLGSGTGTGSGTGSWAGTGILIYCAEACSPLDP